MSVIAEYLLVDCLEDFGQYITYYPRFVNITGSLAATILLFKLIWWGRISDDPDGICKSEPEILEATGMTATELRNARKILVKAGLLKETRKGVPCKLFLLPLREEINRRWMAFIKGARSMQRELQEAKAQKYIHAPRVQGKFSGNREASFPETEELTTMRVSASDPSKSSFPETDEPVCRNPENKDAGNRETSSSVSGVLLYTKEVLKEALKEDLKKKDPPLPPRGESEGQEEVFSEERSEPLKPESAIKPEETSPDPSSSHVEKINPPLAPPAKRGAVSKHHPELSQELWDSWHPMFKLRRDSRDDRAGFMKGFDQQIEKGADVEEIAQATRYYIEQQLAAHQGKRKLPVPPDGIRYFKGSTNHPTPYWQGALEELQEGEGVACVGAGDDADDAPDISRLPAEQWSEADRAFWLSQFERLNCDLKALQDYGKSIRQSKQAAAWMVWARVEWMKGRFPRYNPLQPYPLSFRPDGTMCETINGELIPRPDPQPSANSTQVNVNHFSRLHDKQPYALPKLTSLTANYAASYSQSRLSPLPQLQPIRASLSQFDEDYDVVPF